MALIFELLNNESDVFRWNIESDTDGPSLGRKYRCIDPNHFTLNVESWSSRISSVHRRVDLNEIFVGSCAYIAPAR